MGSVINLLSSNNYAIVNKKLVGVLGIKAAYLLGELAGEYEYFEVNGMLEEGDWFFSTATNVTERTQLSKKEQLNAIEKLKDAGILEVKCMGLPARRYFRFNEECLLKCLNLELPKGPQVVPILHQQVGAVSAQLKVQKRDIKNNKERIQNKNTEKNSYISTQSQLVEPEVIDPEVVTSKRIRKFRKPTLQEIEDYVLEKGYHFDAEKFFAYYESNGWKVGKNPMKDWKMACLTWEKNNQPQSHQQQSTTGNIFADIYAEEYGKDIYGK